MIAMEEYRPMRTRTVRRYVLAPTKYRQFGMRAFRCDVSRARRTGSLRWNIDMFERACVDLEVFVSIIEFEDGGATASAVIPARDLEMRSLEDTQRSPGLTVAHQASLTTSGPSRWEGCSSSGTLSGSETEMRRVELPFPW